MDVHLQHKTIRIPKIRNATQQWEQRETLLLQLRCRHSGVVGYGEATPLPGFSRETLNEADAWLRGVDLTPLSFVDSSDVSHLFGARELGREAIPPAARFCLESALLTGYCSAHGVTLEQALFALSAPFDVPRVVPATASVESAALLDVFGDGAEERALELSGAGVSVFKIKIGRELDSEFRRIATIVNLLQARGRSLRLRLDANQSLSLHQVAQLGSAWRALPIEYLEEPCATTELVTSNPHRNLGLPIALDESLSAGESALRPWLDSGQVLALVCKPMYLGGILETARWVRLASERRIDVVVSHLFDGPWALRVYEAMARVFAPDVVAGLAPHAALPAFERELHDLSGSCD